MLVCIVVKYDVSCANFLFWLIIQSCQCCCWSRQSIFKMMYKYVLHKVNIEKKLITYHLILIVDVIFIFLGTQPNVEAIWSVDDAVDRQGGFLLMRCGKQLWLDKLKQEGQRLCGLCHMTNLEDRGCVLH